MEDFLKESLAEFLTKKITSRDPIKITLTIYGPISEDTHEILVEFLQQSLDDFIKESLEDFPKEIIDGCFCI